MGGKTARRSLGITTISARKKDHSWWCSFRDRPFRGRTNGLQFAAGIPDGDRKPGAPLRHSVTKSRFLRAPLVPCLAFVLPGRPFVLQYIRCPCQGTDGVSGACHVSRYFRRRCPLPSSPTLFSCTYLPDKGSGSSERRLFTG